MTGLLTVVAIWVGAVAAVATPVVYAAGNRWWTNYWGRTLMAKDVVIGLAYARSVTTLLRIHFIPTVDETTVVISMAMAVALLANLAVMIRVTFRRRDVTSSPPSPPAAAAEPTVRDPVP
jgi:hypothetical protein